MDNKTQRVRKHLRENKTTYISAGVAAAAGVIGGFALGNGGTQIVDSFKLTVVNWKSPHISQTTLIRRGHPGNMIKCIETGELFASQNRAAEVLRLSASNLSQHLKGKYEHVGGLHFEKLGEAA